MLRETRRAALNPWVDGTRMLIWPSRRIATIRTRRMRWWINNSNMWFIDLMRIRIRIRLLPIESNRPLLVTVDLTAIATEIPRLLLLLYIIYSSSNFVFEFEWIELLHHLKRRLSNWDELKLIIKIYGKILTHLQKTNIYTVYIYKQV